jgi:hypothetical protein
MEQCWKRLWATDTVSLRNIYVELAYQKGVCYPITWPETFADLRRELEMLVHVRYHALDFEDAAFDKTGTLMRVCNESAFEALVPKQLELYNGRLLIYYVGLKLPTRQCGQSDKAIRVANR